MYKRRIIRFVNNNVIYFQHSDYIKPGPRALKRALFSVTLMLIFFEGAMPMLRSGRTIRTTGGSSRLPMEILGFDSVINRRGTGSVKYDAILKRGYPESVLPLWIADMDFQTAHPILRAMQDRLNHGIFGYDEPSEAYFEAIMGWWADYHRYELRRDWILASPGVMFSLSLAIRAFTSPGDAVMIQTPVYYPFFKAVEANNRRLVTCPLLYSNKSYSIDFDEFQNTIQAQDVKAFILCNPHNPVGRVWTPLELEKMGSICLRSGVIVLSDEIHCDITAPDHKHTVFAGVNSRIEQITATLTSPSKTFNLPGFHASHIFIANRAMRQAWMNEKTATCEVTVLPEE